MEIEIKHLKKEMKANIPSMLSKLKQPVSGIVVFDSIEKEFEGYIYVYEKGGPSGNRRLIPASVFIDNILEREKILATIK